VVPFSTFDGGNVGFLISGSIGWGLTTLPILEYQYEPTGIWRQGVTTRLARCEVISNLAKHHYNMKGLSFLLFAGRRYGMKENQLRN
jgi:hypothetical protein